MTDMANAPRGIAFKKNTHMTSFPDLRPFSAASRAASGRAISITKSNRVETMKWAARQVVPFAEKVDASILD